MNGGGGGFQDWAELRTHYLDVYGDTPRAETESRIINAYELHPAQVERALAAAAVDLEAGTIRSGWAIVAKRCETLTSPPSNPSRAGGATREKAIARANQWLHNAGCYHDETEAILHLCDTNGLLSSYAQAELINDGPGTPARLQTTGDPTVIAHIRAQHTLERPRGLAADTAAEARAEQWKTQRAKEPPRTKSTSPNSAPATPASQKSSPSSTPSKPPTPTSPPTNNPTTATPTTSSAPSPASSPNLENTPL